MIKTSTKPVYLPIQMVVTCGAESPLLTELPSGCSEPTDDEAEVTAIYKPSESKESKVRNCKDVKKHKEEQIERDWCNKAKIADAFVECKNTFIEFLSEFESIWDAHLGGVNIERRRVEVPPADAKSNHSVPYWVGPKAQEFAKTVFTKCCR